MTNDPNRRLFQQGIVLQTNAFRDADLIVTVLTEDSGKIAALARGARRSKRRFMGGIDLFDCGSFEFSPPKKGHLYHLHGITSRKFWQELRNSFIKLTLASFCLEITNIFAPEGDAEGSHLFEPLVSCLGDLANADHDNASYEEAIFFTLRLLRLSGVNPLEDKLAVKNEVQCWWTTMLAENHSSPVPDPTLLNESFGFLLGYIEKIIGKKLRTHNQCAHVWSNASEMIRR